MTEVVKNPFGHFAIQISDVYSFINPYWSKMSEVLHCWHVLESLHTKHPSKQDLQSVTEE